MDRGYYQKLAADGLRMPIGADLILHEQPDPAAVLLDGVRYGRVMEATARRFRTPLALPVMDLTLEKVTLLGQLGISASDAPRYHFSEPPSDEALAVADREWDAAAFPWYKAQTQAISHIARETGVLAMGMVIGPFSLMTKMMSDPIAPVYLAGEGVSGEEDPEVATVERCLEMSVRFILRVVEAQVRAGAKAVCVAEPAGNVFYISPHQMAAGSDVFRRFVLAANQRIKARLNELGADLFLHSCGELTNEMLRHYVELDPAVISLGSSRRFWEDAAVVPESTVLFGNMPSKRFYSDHEMTCEQVRSAAGELLGRMQSVGRPFILGSECDVLDVPGCHEVIMGKVRAFMEAEPSA